MPDVLEIFVGPFIEDKLGHKGMWIVGHFMKYLTRIRVGVEKVSQTAM